jgi:hypothetical protein
MKVLGTAPGAEGSSGWSSRCGGSCRSRFGGGVIVTGPAVEAEFRGADAVRPLLFVAIDS